MTKRSANSVRAVLDQPRAAIMGIINVTPDSFSDGGQFLDSDAALRHGMMLVEDGADILDVGGESTRPGAAAVGQQQELDRVIPVIERLVAATDTPISIDSRKPSVMRAAVDVGASMINDVDGVRSDESLSVVSRAGVPVCIMHMQGDPVDMQLSPQYEDVVNEVSSFLKGRVDACVANGMSRRDLIVDPGIGFGKTLSQNLALLAATERIQKFTDCPVLVGSSRKSLIDKLLCRRVDERLAASLGLTVQSVLMGAKIVRVHDVRETYDAVRSVEAVKAAT